MSESESEPEVNLDGKVSVPLLPLELTVNLMETPITTITFFEGDYTDAADYLRTRVVEIVYRNPWLGGWLAQDPKTKETRLWYDPSSDDFAPGIFHVFEPGQIPLSREASYDTCYELVKLHGAKVRHNNDLIGKNEAIFKIAIIPDELNPSNRFSLVTSMSHIGGDKHTYYQIFNMLYKGTAIWAMNPNRKMEVIQAAFDRMGQKESFYFRNATNEPMWKAPKFKEDIDPMQLKIFFLRPEWLDHRKQQQEYVRSEESHPTSRQSDYALLASWFFRLVNAKVGLLAFNFRNFLDGCDLNDTDAGNYQNPIPLTPVDYLTPRLVQQALDSGKRCGTDPIASLPLFHNENSCSIAIDWAESKDAALDIGGTCEETLHVPLYSSKELRSIHNKLSFMVMFTASGKTADHSRRGGLFVVAAKSIMAKIEECGIVEEMIYFEDK